MLSVLMSSIGSRIIKWVGIAAALLAAIFYVKRQGRQEEQERQLKLNLEDYSDTRKRIDEVVRNTPDDYDAARQWLLDRNSKRGK